MLDNIFYNLIYIEEDNTVKLDILDRLKQLPKQNFDSNTKKLIQILDMIVDSKVEINKKTFNSYIKMYKEFDPDIYFWDTREKEASEIDLESSVKLYIKESLKKLNSDNLENTLELYKKTGDESLLQKLEFKNTEDKKYVHSAKDFMQKTMHRIESIKEGRDEETLNFSNKFFYLQIATKGLTQGEFILVAARPGTGKTAFGISLLNEFSKTKKVLYISYEMTMEEIGMRMLQAKAGITTDVIFSKDKFTNEKYEEVEKAKRFLSEQDIKIIDEPPSDFLKLREVIRKEKKQGLDLVIIDYLGLIRQYAPNDTWNPYITTSQISGDMKMLAKELKIPIIALQQVNRKVTAGSDRDEASYKELQLTDLRDSGSLEQDANKVFFIWNKKAETEEDKKRVQDGIQDIIVSLSKNRNGKSNQKFLYEFNKNLQRIKEVKWLTAPSSWNEGGKKDE